MKLLEQVKQTVARCLARFEGHAGDGPILVAVSGGRDSVALLWLLAELRGEGRLSNPIHVGHVDHAVHDRSAEAAEHVREFCDELGLPSSCTRLADVPKTEEALRDARYEALTAMAGQAGSRIMVTGHHADDNMETVLFRMLRGTGPRGLAGIPEFRQLHDQLAVIRPLLTTRRSTLDRLAQQVNLRWIVDPTNADLRYARNQLRHELIPSLQASLGSRLDMSLLALARTARAITDMVDAQALRVITESARFVTPWRCEVRIEGWDPRSEPIFEEVVSQIHARLHPGRRRPPWTFVRRVIDLIDSDDGQRVAGPGSLLVERTRQGLLFIDTTSAGLPPAPAEAQEQTQADDALLPLAEIDDVTFGGTEWRVRSRVHAEPPLDPAPNVCGKHRALLDPRAAPRPWSLRVRRPGDRFWPLGAAGPVELRRFLQSRHLPRFDRSRIPLVVDAADQILWVPGVEIADRCRIQLDTGACLEVELLIGGEIDKPASY